MARSFCSVLGQDKSLSQCHSHTLHQGVQEGAGELHVVGSPAMNQEPIHRERRGGGREGEKGRRKGQGWRGRGIETPNHLVMQRLTYISKLQ